jgi:hypothetical protein
MKTIYKYPIDASLAALEMHSGAIPLTVQLQDGRPYLWALVDTEQPKELRDFEIYGTGHPIDTNIFSYVGTFQMSDGLVFHFFIGENDGK